MKNRDMQIVQMEKFYLVLESKCAQNGGHWFSILDNPPIQKFPPQNLETDILTRRDFTVKLQDCPNPLM